MRRSNQPWLPPYWEIIRFDAAHFLTAHAGREPRSTAIACSRDWARTSGMACAASRRALCAGCKAPWVRNAAARERGQSACRRTCC